MFTGVYDRKVDSKHRFYVPKTLKKKLSGVLYCSRDSEGVFFFQSVQLLQQLSHSLAFEVEVDNQGRVLIPYQLREEIEKNSNVVVVGEGILFRLLKPSNI